MLRGLGGFAAALLLLCLVALAQAWEPMGRGASGARLERMRASPQWAGEGFENPDPLWNDEWGMVTNAFSGSDYAIPDAPIPYRRVPASRFETPPEGLRVTWLGHSTNLIEIGGRRVLTDPFWGERTSPLTWVGPARWYPPPLAFEDLPSLDAILISHDHYDHLDYPTIVRLKDHDTLFIAPLGVAEHLEYWGVPRARIRELDWWDTVVIGELTITCTPSRHASGRQVFDQNDTLWAGYALTTAETRVFFSGDTGLFDGMREIGERLGPFDLTMLEVGAYGQEWPDWHLGPEQAVVANRWLRGRAMLPIHWGLFDLALHGWTEPIERTVVAAEAEGTPLFTPRPGEAIRVADGPSGERWWPDVPWRTAAEYPIRARRVHLED